MRTYKCRCTNRTKKWMDIVANSPQEAAEIYAEEGPEWGPDLVTVMGYGRFQIFEETVYHARKIIELLLSLTILVILPACGTPGVCRHKAVYCGLVMGEKYSTRIIAGEVMPPGESHAQAQAEINNEWKWLEFANYFFWDSVIIGKQEREFIGDVWTFGVSEYSERLLKKRKKK